MSASTGRACERANPKVRGSLGLGPRRQPAGTASLKSLLLRVEGLGKGWEVQVSHGKAQDSHVHPPTDAGRLPMLETGAKVCVRNRFLGNWSSGFEVVEVLGDGYRIRRVSDGLEFPDVFASEDVRLERRQQPERGIAGSYLDRGH